jgi:predicted GNAT family acetyltransferase
MNQPARITISHDERAKRYETVIDDLHAFVVYELSGDRVVIMHTYVPPELRGRNIAASLVKWALDDIRKAGRKVVPQCSYVQKFIQKNPDYGDLLVD